MGRRSFHTGETLPQDGDAGVMAKKWKGKTQPFAALGESFASRSRPQLLVDAIFGAGLNREFPQSWASAIAVSGLPVVAIDVPSGLDGNTGRPIGACVKADATITFFRKKPGHLLVPGRSLCGDVVVADIGLPARVLEKIAPKLWENEAPVLPKLRSDGHKYSRGHAVVWSGPPLATGAARLAALAAARIGAGLTSITGPEDALKVHAAHVTSMMLKPAEGDAELKTLLEDRRISGFCIGPGAGVSALLRRNVLTALKAGPACALDADALTSFAGEGDDLFDAIKAIPERPCVFTPHDGEFGRLFKQLQDSIESKVEIARRAAAQSGAVIVYKGADTVIAAPDGRAKINNNAPPTLATAGSGDVLAGMITGLLAQGLPGFEAACAGVWLHGDAALKVKRRTVIAEDLIEAIGL